MNDQSRRHFVKTSIAAGLSTALPASQLSAPAAGDMFVHHVYFYLKNKGSEADKAKLLEGLNKLAKVPTIKFVHIGSPATTDRSVIEKGYAVSWLCFFNNLEDEEIYQKHPIHLKFVEDYSALWEKVIVYDSVGPRRS
ncbi:Dabb family protein [Spirosoma rigui]|uniref:Dabb family protein n=1 Tax=Spirosoma rigui TaxID=564064 RepID=UPI0009B0DFF6|nr:Dabb family protein [Spirosoma rigui]